MKEKCFQILFSLILILGTSACGDDYYTDDYLRNNDEKLCGKNWQETYETVLDGTETKCIHSIIFSQQRTGKESYIYYKEGQSIPVLEQNYAFYWDWTDNMEAIKLVYGTGTDEKFENVWARESYLSGKLHGKEVTFRKQ